MRTTEEIVARLHAIKDEDWMGTQTSDLLLRIPFDAALPFLVKGTTLEDLADGVWPVNGVDPMHEAKAYLPFAWEKANNCRGLSASRSIDHFKTWLWLAGKEKHVAALTPYSFYGKPQLVMVSTMCDFDWRKADDGNWVNVEGEAPLSDSIKEAFVATHEAMAKT